MTPLPGDKTAFSIIDEAEGKGFIERVFPRKNQLIRPAIANVDQLAIVIAVKEPEPDFLFLDKLIVIAQKEHICPFICINKSDLDVEIEHVRIMQIYKKTDFPVIVMSSKLGTGIELLQENLVGKITVLAGQSGVGKSTILNRIIGSWVMETSNVSEKIKRGKHTTRHAELFQLSIGGFVADTPGFSSLELVEIEAEELQYFYPEFSRHIGNCRFRSCCHVQEPGCMVKKDVDEANIDQGRYLRYVELYSILKQKKTF